MLDLIKYWIETQENLDESICKDKEIARGIKDSIIRAHYFRVKSKYISIILFIYRFKKSIYHKKDNIYHKNIIRNRNNHRYIL